MRPPYYVDICYTTIEMPAHFPVNNIVHSRQNGGSLAETEMARFYPKNAYLLNSNKISGDVCPMISHTPKFN